MSRAFKSLLIFAAFVIIYTLSRHAISPSSSTTTTSSSTSTSTTSTTMTPTGTTCTGSDFNGTFNQGQGAAGTIFASVTLTKVTPGTCVVDGYPVLTLQDKTGAVLKGRVLDTSPVDFPVAQANDPAASVTVGSATTITFMLGYSDVQTGTTACGTATTLSVQFKAQGTTVTVTPTYPLQPCNGDTVWVSPFY